MADIIRNDTRVWLHLDPFYPPRNKHPNTVFKATAIAMQSMGKDLSYDLLMGISGAAFRVQLHEAWCPSSPHPDCGFSCSNTAAEVLELELDVRCCENGDAGSKTAIIDEIVASIDKGRPALARSEETGLIVGYVGQGNCRQLVFREPYSNKGDAPEVLEDWPWEVVLFRGGPRQPNQATLVDSLKQGVMLAQISRTGENGEYACGFAAYERWITGLTDPAAIKALSAGDEPRLSNANAHIYYCLLDARRCAAEYLRAIAEDLGQEAQAHLQQAAANYDDIASRLDIGLKNLTWNWEFDQAKDWTQPMRNAQAATLQEVLALERSAVTRLQTAVAALG